MNLGNGLDSLDYYMVSYYFFCQIFNTVELIIP